MDEFRVSELSEQTSEEDVVVEGAKGSVSPQTPNVTQWLAANKKMHRERAGAQEREKTRGVGRKDSNARDFNPLEVFFISLSKRRDPQAFHNNLSRCTKSQSQSQKQWWRKGH